MRHFKSIVGAAIAMAVAASPARAAWLEARTDHFVLVTDSTEQRARDFAERLERFDTALRLLYAIPDTPERHNRPVTIYALEPEPFGVACRCAYSGILGWYSRRLDSPTITVTTLQTEKEKYQKVGYLNSQALLLHEYSHHFMLANTSSAYPYWYVEGFAEFNANATFADDGAILLGYPANYRGGSLLRNTPLPMRKLVAPEIHGYGDDPDQTYGRAWLLTHYLMVRPERAGQLGRYLAAMASGTPSLQAAQQVFGDFDAFDRELDRYIRADIAPIRVPAAKTTPEIAIRTMSEGEGRVLLLWLQARRGVARGYGKNISVNAMKLAKAYNDDASAQAMLSEASLLAKHYDEAELQADRALAIDPNSAAALLVKGRVVTARAVEANPAASAGWAAGRKWFARANRAAPNSAEPFYRFYVSYAFAGEQAPDNAVLGLHRARELAPESQDIAWAMIRENLRKGDAASARRLLIPLAFSPHARRDENRPAQVIAMIDAGQLAQAAEAVDRIWREEPGDDDG